MPQTDSSAEQQLEALKDTFNGNNRALVDCMRALIRLDLRGSLEPHGIGGHARSLLAAGACRLDAMPENVQAMEALRNLIEVIEAAGVSNLSRGVELGPVVWSVKCNDAIAAGREALAATPNSPQEPAPQGPALPHPGGVEISALLDSILAEYNWPTNTKNAARAGWTAAMRYLAASVAPSAAPHQGADALRLAQRALAQVGALKQEGSRELHQEARKAVDAALAQYQASNVPLKMATIIDYFEAIHEGLSDVAFICKTAAEVQREIDWFIATRTQQLERFGEHRQEAERVIEQTIRQMRKVHADRVERETATKALELANEAIDSIALAGMSGSGQESEEGMRDWHAQRAWDFIRIAASAKTAIKAVLAPSVKGCAR